MIEIDYKDGGLAHSLAFKAPDPLPIFLISLRVVGICLECVDNMYVRLNATVGAVKLGEREAVVEMSVVFYLMQPFIFILLYYNCN